MSAVLIHSQGGYAPPIPPIPPPVSILDVGEVQREVEAQQPTPSPKKRGTAFTGEEILGLAGDPSADELQRKASLYFLQGNWKKTISTLERLVQIEPSASSYFLLGFCYVNVVDFPNAIRALRQAVKLRPKHFMTQFHLGSSHFMLYQATGDKRELEKAIQPYKKVIALGQERVDIAALSLGSIYSVLGDWRNAEKYYQMAAEVSPDPSTAYSQLAKVYMDMGDEQPAKREYYYLKAIKMFEKLIKITSNKSDPYNFLGHAYEIIGRSDKAIKAYEKAVEFDDGNLLALANLATNYLNAKRYEEAKDVHQRMIRIKPQTVRSYLTQKVQRSDEEINRFRSDAYVGYAVACMELYRRAEADEESADSVDPKLLQEAETALKKAIEIDPRNVNAYYDLAVLYFRQNQTEEARAAVQQALAVDPNNETIKEHVRKLLEEQLRERLLARGAIKEVRKPITDFRPYRNRTMMTIRTKPLSQLVIEERR